MDFEQKIAIMEEMGILVDPAGRVQQRALCPKCSHTRKKSHNKDLSVNIEKGVWNCHHCAYSGNVFDMQTDEDETQYSSNYSLFDYNADIATDKVLAFLKGRGISEDVAVEMQIGEDNGCITFPFFKDGVIVNIKYRGLNEKTFRQEKDPEKCFYNYDAIVDHAIHEDAELIICEGELDTLSFITAGYFHVVSVPSGALQPASEGHSYFDFLEVEKLKPFKKIYLMLDNDAPGRKTIEELARRLGKGRCRKPVYPDGCKDCNDVLREYGTAGVIELINTSQEFPIEGIFTPKDVVGDLLDIHAHGTPSYMSTGWKSFDKYFTIKPGEVTIITGIPGSGKSEFLDNLCFNLVVQSQQRIAMYSPENYPISNHVRKFMEKFNKAPFFGNNRMTKEQLINTAENLKDSLYFIKQEDSGTTIDTILSQAADLVYRFGINILVVDPYNEIEHSRPAKMSETEYISQFLTKCRIFARNHDVHMFIVAHPAKLQKNEKTKEYPVPTPYDISGSAHWRNKADNCIAVHRLYKADTPQTEVHVQKIREKYVGKVGVVKFNYILNTGLYEVA